MFLSCNQSMYPEKALMNLHHFLFFSSVYIFTLSVIKVFFKEVSRFPTSVIDQTNIVPCKTQAVYGYYNKQSIVLTEQ